MFQLQSPSGPTALVCIAQPQSIFPKDINQPKPPFRHTKSQSFFSGPAVPLLTETETVPSLIAILPSPPPARSRIRRTTRVRPNDDDETDANNSTQPWRTLPTGIPRTRKPSDPYPCLSNTMPKPRRAAKRASLVSVITSPRLQHRDPQHAPYHPPPPACPYRSRQIQMSFPATFSRQRRLLHRPRLRLQHPVAVFLAGPLPLHLLST